MSISFLAACLIVRDEADEIAGCLESLAGVVDEVHVHDTGSSDGTPQIASELGAAVTLGRWADDFAAARNEALAGWSALWVLSVDADQRYTGDPRRLRAFLEGSAADVVEVEVDNAHDELPYTNTAAHLFRKERVRWAGRVHERLVGAAPVVVAAPRDAIVLAHEGYARADVRTAKALRNAELARRTLQEAGDDRPLIARTLLDLGRSLIGAGRRQEAVDTLEMLRELFPGTPEWLRGTDFLARLVLAAGLDDVCLTLVGQMRAAGASGPYCDWLAAQALAQLGDVDTATRLLAGVTEVVDTAGRRHDPRALEQLRTLLGELELADRPV
ncbi:glycosyltransferase family 2 protein [Actinoplanes sp. TRM 88003]|uniref:Glycosyltransferase family 2 protein n=1 Tax=Paractinoplanes aksuensis TaxID=2939490 RepID=A0ABT1DNL2_9ACTN|nr:glycosyltransferase family 2 protein [Actinoplanes aksuensis]MCO8272433.1 glycosyltransferase family 2 protein [Actinoplanes aksuensis]